MSAAVLILALLAVAPAAISDSAPCRQTLTFAADWLFHKGDDSAASAAGFDDSTWQRVALPHTWNATDGQDGGNDYHRGPCWYRLRFVLPPGSTGQRCFLRFGAASLVAEVFLNGQRLGEHRGGFTAFCFEVTSHLQTDGVNVLAVRVDNSQCEDVAPWSADFTMFGGLYRDVQLIITGPTCISPLDHASSGVYVKQAQVSAERAELEVATHLLNGRDARPVTVVVELLDGAGLIVQRSEGSLPLESDTQNVNLQTLAIEKPRLWPQLYQARVHLRSADAVIDEVTVPVGLRFLRADPRRGLLVNGNPVRLHGVNCHQDRMDKGWAISPADVRSDFALIREIGCNAVRLAHYPHSSLTYAMCDELGLAVWAEIPLVNRVFDTPEFRANCRRQLVEMIRQNYNHPSIFFWGIHNEVTAPWEPGPDPAPLVRELVDLARQEDPTRLTVCAATDPRDHAANWQTDLVAFNRYFGWYGGEPEEIGAWLDDTHAQHPEHLLGISEYGAGASIAHHELPPTKPKHDGEWHPEVWQAHLHEVHWHALHDRPYVWGTFIWNMFDFASDARREGDATGRNDKGLVTYDRRTRKDAFFFYKAQWSKDPFVHITSRRFTPRKQRETIVRVYTNQKRVELSVNGQSLGQEDSNQGVVEWPDVQLDIGSNAIRAVVIGGEEPFMDECAWIVAPAAD